MLNCDCDCHEWIWFTRFLGTSRASRAWRSATVGVSWIWGLKILEAKILILNLKVVAMMTCQTITITASAVGLKIPKCQHADTHWDGGLVGGGGDRRKDDHNMGAWLQRGGGGAGKARRLARERAWSWLPLLAMMLCWCDDDGDVWKWGWRDDWRGLGGRKGGEGDLVIWLWN